MLFVATGFLPGSTAFAAQQIPSAPRISSSSTPNPSGRKYPPRIYNTVRLSGPPPVVNGRLDDPAWKQGEWAGNYRQQIPVEGAEPSAPTELKIIYDDRNVFVAIRVYDDPALYVVWSQGRTSEEARRESSFSSNWNALWRERPDNVLMVKLTYWFSP